MKHLTFNSSEQEANKCCQKDHLCTSTIQDLWSLIFKAPARLGAQISILDSLRAHLHARINGNCFGAPEQALRHSRSKNAEGQVQPGMPDLGMSELRYVLYGPPSRQLFVEAPESRHQKLWKG